jgi:peptidoglycan/LPS O-acetylase OafA/YrhL
MSKSSLSKSTAPYLGGLDDLRGLAALLVFFYHGLCLFGPALLRRPTFSTYTLPTTYNPLLAFVSEGHSAVGLFLCLSGFLFASGNAGREVRFWGFMRNRFLRIYPLFLTLIVLSGFINRAQFQLLPLLQTLLMLPEYPGGVVMGTLGTMFWTLGVEWKCYLLFPALHRLTALNGRKYLVGVCALFILLRVAAVVLGAPLHFGDAYYTLMGRLDQFCVGMGLGYTFAAGGLRWAKRALPLSVVALLGLLLFYHNTGGWYSLHEWKCVWPTVEALAWGLIAVGYVQLSERATRPLRPLRWAGLLSYSIYLLHFPVISAFAVRPLFQGTAEQVVPLSLLNSLVALPLVLALSTFTYWVVERPALRLRQSYAAAGAPAASSAAVATDTTTRTAAPREAGAMSAERASSPEPSTAIA